MFQIEKTEGLTCLTDNRKDTKVNIVYVHGLGGGGYSTWYSKEGSVGYWPSSIAERFPNFSVWVFNYTADILEHPFKKTKTINLIDKGRWFVDKLETNQVHTKPIVFICHSLGGLLVKQALQLSQSLGPDSWRFVWANTQAVFFLGTPHSGSDLSNTLVGLSQVVNAVSNGWLKYFFKPSKAILDLAKNNPTLGYVDDWYRYYAPVQGIDTIAYAEGIKTYGMMVVDSESAKPHIAGSRYVLLPNEDHISICKPSSDRADVYQGLIAYLDALEQRVSNEMVSTAALVPTKKVLERVGEIRRTVSKICGWWWEVIRIKNNIEISFFQIRSDFISNSVMCKGTHYDQDGNLKSEWKSEIADINLSEDEILIRYYWTGKRIRGEETGEKFQGFGQFKYENPISSIERIDRGSGEFWDLNESHPELTKLKSVERLKREIDAIVIHDMTNDLQEVEKKMHIKKMIGSFLELE